MGLPLVISIPLWYHKGIPYELIREGGELQGVRLYADLHTHTHYGHGTGTVEDNVKAAIAKGLEMVAITEHGPANLFGVGIEDIEKLWVIKSEVEECRKKYRQIKILMGVEANIIGLDGRLDIPCEILTEMDIVIAGLHLMVKTERIKDALGLFLPNTVDRWMGVSLKSNHARNLLMDINTKALVNAVLNNKINIVAHAGWGMMVDTALLAEACVQRGTLLEINASHFSPSGEYVRLAKSQGAMFVINSDAHIPEKVGDFESGIKIAKESGLSASDIINAVGGYGIIEEFLGN